MDSMASEISAFIGTTGSVSFVELANRIDGFKGDRSWEVSEKNICLWSGVSLRAVEAISGLLNTRQIKMTSTDPLVYMCDGGMLNLPIAKQNRKYKSLRWLPVVFNRGDKWEKRKG